MINQEILFNTLNSNTNNNLVDIIIAGSSIPAMVGPTPLVDISRTYTNEDGYLSTITESITLNGKIVPKTSGTGFSPIMSGINALKNLLSKCSVTTLEIKCSGTIVYSSTGVLIKQFNANKTDDNWTRTADFTIELENKLDASGQKKKVEDQVETWSIEPLEEVSYLGFNQLVYSNSEYLSPDMKPTAPSRGAGIPAPFVNSNPTSSAAGGNNNGPGTLGVNTVGQYRITRRLSAKGLVAVSGTGCLSPTRTEANNIKVANAKEWVEEQAGTIEQPNTPKPSGSIHIPSIVNTSTIGTGIVLYNHVRSISTDFYNGTYEMTDTWIAMPTGTTHTESFTIDCSTADNFTKTIRVAGNIAGLIAYDHNKKTDHSFLTQQVSPSGKFIPNLSIGANSSEKTGQINGGLNIASLPSSTPAKVTTTMKDNKYQNAKDAWEKTIKPYLYRRACLGMDQYGKNQRQASNEIDPRIPESPAFFKDRPLNTIPVSTSEGHDPMRGTISYTYEFNNKYRAIPGVISENINVTHDAPADNISETSVLGRYLGPIIQSVGKTNARKTLTIDIVVQPPQGIAGSIPDGVHSPVGLYTDLRNYIDKFVDGHAPFYPRDVSLFGGVAKNNTNGTAQTFDRAGGAVPGTVFVQSNQETWNPTEGRFSKTISWIYQQCDATKHWLDY